MRTFKGHMLATKSIPLRIFICYSRRDGEVADAMVNWLESSGFEVTIDKRDLPFGEEWQEELSEFIRAADTVVWLVSPTSVSSRWVNWELGEVQRSGKRLVPVVVKETLHERLPEALGRIHLLPAEGAFQHDLHLKPLVAALLTDREWIKEHTRLSLAARNWLLQRRPNDQLLRGAALRSAEDWRMSRRSSAPPPDPVVLDWIAASEQESKIRQRNWIIGFAAATALFLLVALFALYQRSVAIDNEIIAMANAEQSRRNEQLANERSARLAIRVAERQRVSGFNVHALLLLVDAASVFDDAAAPAALRIELEKAIERASWELHRKWVSADADSAKPVERGEMDAQDNAYEPQQQNNLNEQSNLMSSEPVDCSLIYADKRFSFRPISEEFEAILPQDLTEICERKSCHILLFQQIVSQGFAFDRLHVFDDCGGTSVRIAETQLDRTRYAWIADDYGFVVAHVEGRKIIVHDAHGIEERIFTLTQSVEPEVLDFLSPRRLVVVSRPTDASAEAGGDVRLSVEYLLAEGSIFATPLSEQSELSDSEVLLQTGPESFFLPTKSCEGGVDWVCRLNSPDGNWMIEERETSLSIFDREALQQPMAVWPFAGNRQYDEHRAVFVGDGPSLLMIDHAARDRILRVSPPSKPGGPWTREEVYRDDSAINAFLADRSGDRLLIQGQPFDMLEFRAKIVSISARQIWRDLGTLDFSWFIGELKDGGLVITRGFSPQEIANGTIHRFPPLSTLVQLAREAIPPECQPDREGDWRSSPCWPIGLD
ncbi:MAG: toll/interleukin-1 receptor domain-containing protein [Pseudomonadota bacterium]